MRINADFSQRVIIRPQEVAWTPSPHHGVERLCLDRIGDEIARATSFVRFSPGSCFPHHYHGGGEEIFVLEGSFEDEHGVHAAGGYVRSPRGSCHTPVSAGGCLLFVKLSQFAPEDRERLEIDTRALEWRDAPEGFSLQPLHFFDGVSTFLVRLAAGSSFARMIHPQGEEMIVLEGSCRDAEGDYPTLTWIRDPGGHPQTLTSTQGCTLFVKTGEVARAESQAAELAPG